MSNKMNRRDFISKTTLFQRQQKLVLDAVL